ncbi:MAG: hypothetical protein MZW92_55050 [Comamonadaceae bacterium]|nr:hypothetical protein [Comamonadaceae bacterium]
MKWPHATTANALIKPSHPPRRVSRPTSAPIRSSSSRSCSPSCSPWSWRWIETDSPGAFWNQLALTSLFVQWVVLGAAAALCLCKRWLDRLDTLVAALAVLGLALLVTLLFSLLGWWFLEPRLDFAASPAPPLGPAGAQPAPSAASSP